MKFRLLFLLQLYSTVIFSQVNIDTSIINLSRKSCIKILVYDSVNRPPIGMGTGFLVKYQKTEFILTCFHVVGNIISIDSKSINYQIYKKVKGITYTGDTINLKITPSIDSTNFLYDYAILTANNLPKTISSITISDKNPEIFVGQPVLFSGYPFGFDDMLTHVGTISGITKEKIFIQSPINSGNSGGALFNANGQLLGIIDFKTWKLSIDFDDYLLQARSQNTKVMFKSNTSDFSPISTDFNINLVQTLKDNLNTGIGGAMKVEYALEKLKRKK